MFDAQCDFAAVVYGVKDNPDRLLLDFTEDLRRSGVRTAGLVQLDSWTGRSDTARYARWCFRRAKSFLWPQPDAGSTAENWQALPKMMEAAILEGSRSCCDQSLRKTGSYG